MMLKSWLPTSAHRLAFACACITASSCATGLPGDDSGGVSTKAPRTADRHILVYVGTYTGANSKGIYAFRLNLTKGALTPLGLAAETRNPSFLALHPNRRFLYAVGELYGGDGKKGGAVSAFAIKPGSGKLTLLNQQSSGGRGPCHLDVDKTGKTVLVANYGGGNIAALPIRSDGSLGEATAFIQHAGSSVNPKRQEGPHAHFISADPSNRFAVVCDLGLDQVLVYRFDPVNGRLTPGEPPFASVKPGSGPRHLAFHAGGRFAYAINELSSTVTAFAWDSKRGRLEERHTVSTLPERFAGDNTTAEVKVHPSGRFLYGSNRGHDSIVVFAINGKSGRLSYVEHQSTQGRTPRNFGIDPTGAYLLAANQHSDSVVVFRIDPKTGRLSPTGETVEVGTPVCVKFVPLAR